MIDYRKYFIISGGLLISGIVLFYISLRVTPDNRFSVSKYAPYAYEIAPATAKTGIQSVLPYFELQKTILPHNTLQVRIRPKGKYMWKTFILKRGYKLYLAIMPDAEGEFNDTANLDYLNYDVPVLVDDKGIIVHAL